MNKCRWVCGAVLTVLLAAGPAMAQRAEKKDAKSEAKGQLGDAAPALKIAEWVKGKKIDMSSGKGKNIYVVEFWATWCPPCRESIPHLTEMQEKYKDKNVIFIGISKEPTSTVKPFVKKMGDKMEYVVAVDEMGDGAKPAKNDKADKSDKKSKKDDMDDDDDDDDDDAPAKKTGGQGATHHAYMDAYGIDGIPHAFIVNKDGVIAWHGHPMDGLDTVLDKILADKWSIKEAKKAETEKAEMAANMQKSRTVFMEYMGIVARGKNNAKSRELGEKFLKLNEKNGQALNEFAWTVLTNAQVKDRDLELSLKMAKAACEATDNKDPAIMDTYARALYDSGKKSEAIKMEKKAIDLLGDSDKLPKEVKTRYTTEFKKALAVYESGKPTKPEGASGDDDDDDDDSSSMNKNKDKNHDKPAAKHKEKSKDDDDDD